MSTVCRVICVASLLTGVQLIAPVVAPVCAAVDVQQNAIRSEQPQTLHSEQTGALNHFNLSHSQAPNTLDDYEPPSGIGSPAGSGSGSGTR